MATYGVAALPLFDMLEDKNLAHELYVDEVNETDSLE